MSQPALSQGIAEVERRVGVALFERRGRVRPPTAAADAVLHVAERVLAATDDLRRYLDAMERGDSGELRVGMIDTVALGRLAATFARFRREHPAVRVELTVDATLPLTEQVAAGALDVAVVVAPNPAIEREGAAFDVVPLFDEALYVYAPSDAAGDEWGPWVSYPRGSQTRSLIEDALVLRGVRPDVITESSNPDVLRQMVHLGVGWCVLPRDVAERGEGGLRRIGRSALVHRPIGIVRRRDRLRHPTADVFVELAVDRGR